MQFTPKKRFAQHFLQDKAILQQIIALINPTPDFHWVEIGPGQGALTRLLLPHVDTLDAIELDRDLIDPLKQSCEKLGVLNVYSEDALRFAFSKICNPIRNTRVVGNLPYNISTPLLFHLFRYRALFKDMHFMLQKEVAERIAASPGSKTYGRLSVMAQWHCQTKLLLEVPKTAFYPTPQVDSALIRLTPHEVSPFGDCDESKLSKIVAAAFNQRRKTLRNSLKAWLTAADWENLGISSQRRPEELSVQDFVRIASITPHVPPQPTPARVLAEHLGGSHDPN